MDEQASHRSFIKTDEVLILPNLTVVKIIRPGSVNTRVETSDGFQLVLDTVRSKPYVGMELDIEEVPVEMNELRPLRAGDPYPELLLAD